MAIDFDRQIIFRSIQDDQIYIDFPKLNYWDCRKTIHIIDQKGQIKSSEDAIITIFDALKGISKTNKLYSSPVGKIAVKLSYKYLNEYRLKKVDECEECRT